MNNTKHTKGPWNIKAIKNQSCNGFDGAETDTAYFIANSGYQDESEEQANTRLISCAPEMLECLKSIKNRIMFNEMSQHELLELCSSAIKKAEGKE